MGWRLPTDPASRVPYGSRVEPPDRSVLDPAKQSVRGVGAENCQAAYIPVRRC